MHPLQILQLTILLTLANGTPVVANKIFGRRFAWPLDAGIKFFDGQPLLGASTTIRGLALSPLVTAACTPLIGLDAKIGAVVAATAMAGDLLSSFVKRRLDLPRAAERLVSTRFRNRCCHCLPAAKRCP
jgi:hypothetical protein